MSSADRRTGVYEIVNSTSGLRYVGSTSRAGFSRRWEAHRKLLRSGEHSSPGMQADWMAYGAGSFRFVVLVVCAPEECVRMEQETMNKLHPEYNVCKIAGSCLGVRHGPETSEKHRAAILGKRMGTRHPMYGKHHTEASKTQISASTRGRQKSDETRERMRAAARRAHPMLGRTQSRESRERISAGLKVRQRVLYQTPSGVFHTAAGAGRVLGCSRATVIRRCRVGKMGWTLRTWAKTFETTGTLGSAGGSATAIRTADT